MNEPVVYRVRFCGKGFEPTADWGAPWWRDCESGSIDDYPWDANGFAATTRFKLLRSTSALHLVYQVEDRFVRSVTTRYGGPVWRDSCVEFFFSPESCVSAGYFNVEVNCGGTLLMAYQRGRNIDRVPIDARGIRAVSVAHTMPRSVDPEIAGPVQWTLELRLPFDLLSSYASFVKPAPGVVWRCNFYKCAEANSHPHWGSWSPIATPKPDFHRPEFFGELHFE